MNIIRFRSITEFHRAHGLPPPAHPLISVVDYAAVVAGKKDGLPAAMVADYYSISVKRGVAGKMHYGQQSYDFDEGIMYFLAPGQVLRSGPPPSVADTPLSIVDMPPSVADTSPSIADMPPSVTDMASSMANMTLSVADALPSAIDMPPSAAAMLSSAAGIPSSAADTPPAGWIMLIHPDFLWHTPLAAGIRHYEYFGYAVNEALFLSGKELGFGHPQSFSKLFKAKTAQSPLQFRASFN